MSREDVVAVSLRVFAIFLVIGVVRFVGAGAVQAASIDPSTAGMMGWVLVVTVPALAVAALLWFFPLTVATRLLPVMREPRPALRADPIEVEGIALTVLGLWLLADALSDAVYYAVFLFYAGRMESPPWDVMPADTVAGLLTTGVEILLGVWLLLGSRGWVRVLRRWRYAGSAPTLVASERADAAAEEREGG